MFLQRTEAIAGVVFDHSNGLGVVTEQLLRHL